MTKNGGKGSPIPRQPDNIADLTHAKALRNGSGSGLPVCDLDPATQRLLEENEGMLYEINSLTRELQLVRGENDRLNGIITEKTKELDVMRERLGDANVNVCDASGKVVNYKTECERLTADNKRLIKEYDEVCLELQQRTDNIRNGIDGPRTGSARGGAMAQVEQFYREMLSFLPTVDRIVSSLKRCVVVNVQNRERVLESVQKELHAMQRLAETVQRINVVEERRIEELLACARKNGSVQSSGDLAILIRWMIVQAFESGMAATEGNLRAMESLLTEEGNGTANGGGGGSSVGNNRGNSDHHVKGGGRGKTGSKAR